MPRITLTQPTGIRGEHHPAGATVEVTPEDARHLLGIGKAVHASEAPAAGEVRVQAPAVETQDPKKGRR